MIRRAVVLAVVLAACKREQRERPPPPAPALPPLAAAPTTLPVAGFGEAAVVVPAGVTRAVPVVVAVLGIGDTAEEQCATWRDIVGTRAFVLCPRGAPHMVQEEPEESDASAGDDSPEEEAKAPEGARLRQSGFYPVDLSTLDREVTAGLAALKKRFSGYVDAREVVYVGFSRGAFLGASLAAKHPETYTRAILVEGGHSPWQAQAAAAFAKGGGKRILFACGRPSCVDDAEAAAATLRAQKIETRIVHGAGEGHGYKRQVKEELRRSFDWLTEGEPTWFPRP